MNVENVKFQNQGWKKSKAENESINDNPCLITQKENDKRRIQCQKNGIVHTRHLQNKQTKSNEQIK